MTSKAMHSTECSLSHELTAELIISEMPADAQVTLLI